LQKGSGKGVSISAGALLGEPGGGSFPGDLEEYGEEGSGVGISLCGGPTGEPGRGLVYWGLMCRRRPWRWASLSLQGPC